MLVVIPATRKLKIYTALGLNNNQISDISAVKGLGNLTQLSIENCDEITDAQVSDLQKALPGLKIIR